MKVFLIALLLVLFAPFLTAQIETNEFEALKYANEHVESAPDSAFYIAKSIYLQYTNKGDPLLKAQSGLVLGKILFYQGTFNKASEYLIASSKIFDALEKKKELAESYTWLGAVYQYARQYPLAFKYYQDALSINKALNNSEGIAETLGWIGHYYEKLGATGEAISYQHKALKLFNQQKAESQKVAKIYDNLGSLYEDLAVYDSAYYYFQKSYQNNKNSGKLSNQITNLNNIGDVYRKTGYLQKAVVYADSALALAKKLGLKYQMRSAFKDLSKIYALKNDFKNSYIYLDSALAIYTEIFNSESAQRMTQLQSLYESQRKEAQIAQLKEEQQTNKKLRIALMSALILVLVAAIAIFRYQKLKLKSNKQFNDQQEKLLSAEQEILMIDLKNSMLNEQNLRAELLNRKLIEKQLREELSLKSQSLTTHTLSLIRKNNFLDSLKEKLITIKKLDKINSQKAISQLIESIHLYSEQEEDWTEFQRIFEEVHTDFFTNLKSEFPKLSSTELKLAALLKLNLSSKDISTILGISQDSLRVARYRLRKKLNLSKGSNLIAYLMVQ